MIIGRTARTRLATAVFAAALVCAAQAAAGELQVQVLAEGAPLEGAVVSLHGAAAPVPGQAVMDQRNTAFEPGVLVIEAGTAVSFPNSDTVRHQVYSFSRGNRFELRLYGRDESRSHTFAAVGVALAVVHETGIPLKYIGVGEAMEDLRPFDAEAFVEAILR